MKSIIVFVILLEVISALNFESFTEASYDPKVEQEFAECVSKKTQESPINPFLGTGRSVMHTIPFVKAFCWDMTIFRSIVIECGEKTKITDIKDESISKALRDTAVLFKETCTNTTRSAELAVCVNQQFEVTERRETFPCENFSEEFEKIHKALENCKMEPTLQEVLKRGLENQKRALCTKNIKL